MTAKIKEFGSITEEDGRLIFKSFWIDGNANSAYLDTTEAIVSLVIKRLQKELRLYKKRRVTVDMSPDKE